MMTPSQGTFIFKVIVPVNDKHHQATQNDYHLQRRIGVKGQSAKQQRDGQKVAVLHAVTQVKVEKMQKSAVPSAVSKAVRLCKNQAGITLTTKGANHQYFILKKSRNARPSVSGK